MAQSEQDKKRLQKIGQNIRAIRKAQGIAQEDLAYQADVARGYMGMIERGESNVSLLMLLRIADTLQVPVDRFFE